MHRFQMNDTELKNGKSPSAEQIAWATDAKRILDNDSDNARSDRGLGDLGLGEHSALLELLRQDERLSSLFSEMPARDRSVMAG